MVRSRRTLRRRMTGSVALSGALLVASIALPFAVPSAVVAAPGVKLDVEPEDGTTAVGGTVTLTASIFDGSGDPDLTDQTIRFYFVAGSANDPGNGGQQPRLHLRHRHGRDLQRHLCRPPPRRGPGLRGRRGRSPAVRQRGLERPRARQPADTVHRTIAGSRGPDADAHGWPPRRLARGRHDRPGRHGRPPRRDPRTAATVRQHRVRAGGHTILFFFLGGSDNDPGGLDLPPGPELRDRRERPLRRQLRGRPRRRGLDPGFDADGIDWHAGSFPSIGSLVDVVHRTIDDAGADADARRRRPRPHPTPTPTPDSDAHADTDPTPTARRPVRRPRHAGSPDADAHADADPTPTPTPRRRRRPRRPRRRRRPRPRRRRPPPRRRRPTPTPDADADADADARPRRRPRRRRRLPRRTPHPESRPTPTPAPSTIRRRRHRPRGPGTVLAGRRPAGPMARRRIGVPVPSDGRLGGSVRSRAGRWSSGGGGQVAITGPARRHGALTGGGRHRSANEPFVRRAAPATLVGGFVRGVADRIGPTVQPAAAAAVATTFGFPLILMLAVLLFLIVQSRLDGRDPKLRSAPLTTAETFLPSVDEDRS